MLREHEVLACTVTEYVTYGTSCVHVRNTYKLSWLYVHHDGWACHTKKVDRTYYVQMRLQWFPKPIKCDLLANMAAYSGSETAQFIPSLRATAAAAVRLSDDGALLSSGEGYRCILTPGGGWGGGSAAFMGCKIRCRRRCSWCCCNKKI